MSELSVAGTRFVAPPQRVRGEWEENKMDQNVLSLLGMAAAGLLAALTLLVLAFASRVVKQSGE